MARELRRMGVRLTAEGVNQYKEDLRSAGREARLMSQETRLAMAELGTGASSTERLTTRLKGLGREYNVQEQRVRTLTNSQKEFQTSLNLVGREIKTTSSQLKDSQRETNRLENNYRKMGEALGWNAEETKKAKAEWEASKNETKQLANSLSDLEREQSQYTKELNKMPGQINSAKIAMQEKANEMARLREEYIKNGGALGNYADRVEETSQKVRTFSEGIADVGDRLTAGVTLPIVAGVTATIKAASDWESAFAGTRKTVDEVVDANGDVIYSYERLEGELRSLAKELPATHSEIAEVAEAAGQLGIETENVISFTRTMIDMGESTNLSAEQAASSLARLANITGMSQNDFDRLGSSVVALGNNFATTEAEIVEMGLRLAGTGNQIGMTEADIMGLAAAMSSVGIQAEAGGTAMSTVLKRMQNAVADGSEELVDFAKVSRMSASEFADAFRDDPARALQAFVEGLEESSNEGENLNSILGDLGITGIREADTLLRLAGNSEILGSALDMSATGWEENTALAEEAGVRYETLESQLGMLRNEVYDITIEFGGPFVQALRDAVQAGKPLLENVADMARAFSDLDEEQQQTIIRLIGITAAAGPTLSILGRVGKGAANAGDGFAWLIRKVGGLQAAAQTADPIIQNTGSTIADLGPIATTAAGSKGVGGLVTAVGTSLPWALGIAAAAAGGWAVWKIWGEEAWNASEQTRKWGTVVGEETNNVLTDVQGLGSQITGEFGLIAQGFDTDSSIIAGNFTEIGETIENSVIARISALDEIIENLPETVRGTLGELHEEERKQAQTSLEIIQENNEEIAQLRQQASDNNRELSRVELERINQMSRESIEAYVAQLPIAKSEQKEILDAMSGDVENATQEQARAWAISLGEQRAQMKSHNDAQKKEYLNTLEDLGYSEQYILEAGKTWDRLNETTTLGLEQQMATIAEKYPEIMEEIILSNGTVAEEAEIAGKYVMQLNEDLLENAKSLSYRLRITIRKNAKNLAWMGDEATKAGQTWNNIVFDEKTGNVKTNVREAVLEATEDIDTWNRIRPLVHNADLDSNAKLIIGEAAIAHGRWDGMAWEDKQAILEDHFSEEVYLAIVNEGLWDELHWKERIALLNNGFTDTVIQAMIDDERWEQLEWEEQMAILKTNTPETLQQVLKDIGVWETLPIAVRNLLADKSQLDRTVELAQQKLNSLKDREVTLRVRNETIYESIYRTRGNPTSANFVQSGGRILHNATGTNYFEGGLTWLGDGGKREPYLTPDGEFGVSGSSNKIYDLPRGTRIWPTRQAFKTSARSNPEYRKFIDYLPKFAKGGTIRNPYEGYTALVGEAGPEIFQVAQGNVSITPISQGQRTKVLEQQNNNGNNQNNELFERMLRQNEQMLQLLMQGQNIDINIDKRNIARATINAHNEENDKMMSYKQRGLAINEH